MRPKRLLVLSFLSLLAVSCMSEEEEFESFSFTAEDAAEISALLEQVEQGGGGESVSGPLTQTGAEAQVPLDSVEIDASLAHRYEEILSSLGAAEEGTLRVTNAFLNVRNAPSVRAEKVEELKRGDRLKLVSFPNASWVEVELQDGRKGYVSMSYVALLTSERGLPKLEKQYEGLYYVNFPFLNVRAEPSTQSQKLGELEQFAIIRPLAFEGEWARIPLPSTLLGEGGAKEGYISAQYLKAFVPTFLVRQEQFALPILRYPGGDPAVGDLLVRHLALLQAEGRTIMTFRDFYELLLKQEERDVRLPPKAVLVAVTDITAGTLKEVTDALRATGVRASLFLRTSELGPDGISPAQLQSLANDGQDLQSAGHHGEDLRSLTNSQVQLDLLQSRQILEDLTGREVLALAYPGGGMNDRIAGLAVEGGYLFGLTNAAPAEGSFGRSQLLRLPSYRIAESTTDEVLREIVGQKREP